MVAKPAYQHLTWSLPFKSAFCRPSALYITNLLFQSVNSCPIPSPSATAPASPGFPPCSKMKVRLLAVTLKGFCDPDPAFLPSSFNSYGSAFAVCSAELPCLDLSKLCLGGSCVHANQNPNSRQDMSLLVTPAVNPVSDTNRFSISPR